MVRRRRRGDGDRAPQPVPEALLGGTPAQLIDRWLSDADRAAVLREVLSGLHHRPRTEEEQSMDQAISLAIAARHRLRDAREAWAEAAGLSWHEAGRLIRAAEVARRGA